MEKIPRFIYMDISVLVYYKYSRIYYNNQQSMHIDVVMFYVFGTMPTVFIFVTRRTFI